MKIDLVQFIYSFVLVPLMFIWLKTLLFVLVRNELNVALSLRDIFVIDTIFSTVFLFISFFVVIHAITKSFDLKRERDPVFDLWELSEYFHLTLSHFVIYGGVLLASICISLINVIVPFSVVITKQVFYSALLGGIVTGILFQISVDKYDVATRQFLRIMKLFYGLGFVFHTSIYFLFDIHFGGAYIVYWFCFMLFTTLVAVTVFVERSTREHRLLPFTLTHRKSLRYAERVFGHLKKLIVRSNYG